MAEAEKENEKSGRVASFQVFLSQNFCVYFKKFSIAKLLPHIALQYVQFVPNIRCNFVNLE